MNKKEYPFFIHLNIKFYIAGSNPEINQNGNACITDPKTYIKKDNDKWLRVSQYSQIELKNKILNCENLDQINNLFSDIINYQP